MSDLLNNLGAEKRINFLPYPRIFEIQIIYVIFKGRLALNQ